MQRLESGSHGIEMCATLIGRTSSALENDPGKRSQGIRPLIGMFPIGRIVTVRRHYEMLVLEEPKVP